MDKLKKQAVKMTIKDIAINVMTFLGALAALIAIGSVWLYFIPNFFVDYVFHLKEDFDIFFYWGWIIIGQVIIVALIYYAIDVIRDRYNANLRSLRREEECEERETIIKQIKAIVSHTSRPSVKAQVVMEWRGFGYLDDDTNKWHWDDEKLEESDLKNLKETLKELEDILNDNSLV